MAIIFNEEEHAKEIIKNGIQFTSKKHYDLQVVATYLRENGKNDEEIEKELHRIAKMSFSDYNWVKLYKSIDTKVKRSKKNKIRKNPEIIVTQSELDIILAEENLKVRNLMFVCLVLAKYYMSNNHTDKYYVKYNDVDIFNLCDVFVKKSERLELMHYLDKKGYITPTVSMSFEVHYVNENSEVVLKFKPDVDMVYYFEQYLGGLFINCENCGKLAKKTNNKIKYCKRCSKIKKEEAQDRRYKVYLITNTVNGLRYVGRTSQSLNSRFNNGAGYKNCCINYDIEKYGWDKFKTELIKDGLTRDESYELEKIKIEELETRKKGYNISEGGKGEDNFKGFLITQEKELTNKINRKKNNFKDNLIQYKNSAKCDDKYVYYCIENDAYFKGFKTLCRFLKTKEETLKHYISYGKSYYNKTFIKSNKEYNCDKITEEIKKDINSEIFAKIENELNNPYL